MSATDRLIEALEGRYRIERELGEGGMATVYLADDLRHERKVALKVLKPELAAVVGAERFVAEIKTTANLQHPHILPLFDSGEAGGFLFYVMPYVEGESLRDRLDREKQLPVDEAIRIATAVAGALQVAHDAGVIHRDIKPANIMLSRGQPLVADFGIALAVGAGGGNRLTETGLSVGTPFYMSPEQATGDQPVGPASDVYALAAMLYEMLVGDPPYVGSTAQAVLGKIIQGEPVSATKARRSVPHNVDAAIRKALEKLPADRFGRADDFARALEDAGFRHGTVGGAAARGIRAVPIAAAVVTALAAGVGGVLVGRALAPDPPPPPLVRIVETGDSVNRVGNRCCGPSIAFSPDGSTVAFVVRNQSGTSLFVRRVDEYRSRLVDGTEGGATPFFSPDGRWLGFVRDQALLRVDLEGGAPLTVANFVGNERVRGASWGDDGWIYVALAPNMVLAGTSIVRVSEEGGARESVTEPDSTAGERARLLPHALPGGRAILYVSWPQDGRDEAARVHVFDLADGSTRMLTQGIHPYYADTGHLVYALADGSVMARRFDLDALEVEGEPVRLAGGVMTHNAADTEYAVSRSGSLAYRPGEGTGSALEALRMFSLEGRLIESLPSDFRRSYPRISPDGQRIAFGQNRSASGGLVSDLWVLDLTTGIANRLTVDGRVNTLPVWSRDGTRILYTEVLGDDVPALARLMSRRVDLSEPATPLGDLTEAVPDGGALGFGSPSGGPIPLTWWERGDTDLWLIDEDGTRPRPFLATEFQEGLAAVSPSGDLIAYTSDQSGSEQVYIQPFPEGGPVSRISVAGGEGPVWISDDELLYRSPSAALTRVRIVREGTTVRPSGHREIIPDVTVGDNGPHWDVAPDGQWIITVGGVGSPALFIEVNRLHQLAGSGP